jgi:hypothetical protein
MDLGLAFFGTWLVGIALTAIIFVLTRSLPWRARANLRALVVAAAFTPGVVLSHSGAGLVPAILMLAWAPFMPQHGGFSALLLGALPIALAWAALRLWWPRLEERDNERPN